MIDRQRKLEALLRTQFAAFAMKAAQTLDPGTNFLPNWHHEALALALDRVRVGETKRLVVNLPPRTAKSIYATALCAFIHGHDPSKKIAVLSYSSELAGKLARDYRTIITSDWYRRLFPATRIGADKNTEAEIVLTARGYRLAWSMTGTITGRGADLIIIDDPIKAEDAFSETIRSGVNEAFDGTILSRLDDKQRGAIILLMQRFHPEDLSGHVLAKGGWEHLRLSAIAEADEAIPVGGGRLHFRRAGEALHPEREPIWVYERAMADIGAMRWSAQYQQNPIPLEGNLIKWAWFERYARVPDPEPYDSIVQSWDTAGKAGATNAYSVCVTFLKRGQKHYLLHVLREKLDYPLLKRKLIAHAAAWNATTILIEAAALGEALIQDLRADPTAPQPIAVIPERDKITRMLAASALIEARCVFIPEAAEWLGEFQTELLQFPHSARMDQVDALSQYLNWAKRREAVSSPYYVGSICFTPAGEHPSTNWR